MAKAVLFDEGSAERIGEAVRAVEGAVPRLQRDRRGGRSVAGPPIQWGLAAADWPEAAGTPNLLTITPASRTGTALPEMEPATRTIYVCLPADADPGHALIFEGDLVAYIPFWDEAADELRGVLVAHAPAGTANDPAACYEGTFESETANATTWSRAAQPAGKDGVQVMVQTRTAYVHDGEEKLYGFYQIWTFDSMGMLKAVSAETRVEIDEPGECT